MRMLVLSTRGGCGVGLSRGIVWICDSGYTLRVSLWCAGLDGAVGRREGRSLPLEELEDGLYVGRHLGLQPVVQRAQNWRCTIIDDHVV